MKLDWLTDPHLDHLPSERELIEFVKRLHDRDSDGLLISGDIAESPTIYEFLGIISGAYQRPVYFVLGNHDYYKAWMAETRERVRAVCEACPPGILNWLTESEPLHLEEDVWIVGHDGWYDGREGNKLSSSMAMTDFVHQVGVFDLASALGGGQLKLFLQLRHLAEVSARVLHEKLEAVLEQGASRVLIVTHVPPFLEASLFRGRPSSPDTAPYYVNKTLGDMLNSQALRHPDVFFEVFCGHTHAGHQVDIQSNLRIRSGTARYGTIPRFQEPLHI